MAGKTPKEAPKYRALVGMNYPPDHRVEAGDIAHGLPEDSIKSLLAQGAIEEAE